MSKQRTLNSAVIALLLFVMVIGCIMITGCASILGSKGKESAPKLLVTLHFNTIESYRVGEAAICIARLINISRDPLTVKTLNAQSLMFWTGEATLEDMRKIEPVYSSQEDMNRFVSVEPYQYIERPFVFTTFTETSGTKTLQAIYEGIVTKAEENKPQPIQVISSRIFGEVEEPPLLKRDIDGILLKEDAVRIVKEKSDVPIYNINPQLVIDDAGFLAWWITFTYKTSQGKEVQEGVLVNPYLGVTRGKVQPYVEKADDEKQPLMPFKRYQRFKPPEPEETAP